MKQKGFTLIELLVTISIISLLSSIVLGSVTQARRKAQDGRIQSQLVNFRTAAAVYLETAGSAGYGATGGTICIGPPCNCLVADNVDGTVFAGSPFITAANYPTGVTFMCASSATAYAISVSLTSQTPTVYWCVDSNGRSIQRGTAITTTSC